MISQKINRYILNRTSLFNPSIRIARYVNHLLRQNGVNICYNKYARAQYRSGYQNILLALESPAMVEHHGWLDSDMQFAAEISFKNYYKLDHYKCCRTLYINNDNFVGLRDPGVDRTKGRLVSMIYSNLNFLSGHKLRHQVAVDYRDKMDLFGAGTGTFLKEKRDTLSPYRFQVVIENGKYPEYVSEKLFDCLKTYTIPVYWGGETALRKMGFDTKGMLFFDNVADLGMLFREKINEEYYHDVVESVEYNRKRLVELRNEAKMDAYYYAYYHRYSHTVASYLGLKKSRYNYRLQ